MTVRSKQLVAGVQLPATSTELYVASNVIARIDAMTICNTTAGAVTATVDLVETGAGAGVTKRIVSARSIGAGETYRCPEAIGHVLNAGGKIFGLAGSATSLTIIVSGREET